MKKLLCRKILTQSAVPFIVETYIVEYVLKATSNLPVQHQPNSFLELQRFAVSVYVGTCMYRVPGTGQSVSGVFQRSITMLQAAIRVT